VLDAGCATAFAEQGTGGDVSESCDDYCDVHEHRIHKARKQHRCSACRAAIRPGDYYASVFVLGGGDVDTFKRCGSCETTWQHLKQLCDESNRRNREHGERLYPREDLGCGLEYEDEWGDLPDEVAVFAFMNADERSALLAPESRK
jgi:hypothetical protein